MADAERRATVVQTHCEEVNTTEHEFCWKQSLPYHSPPSHVRFIVEAEDGHAYRYGWMVKLCGKFLELSLISFGETNRVDNKISVELYVKTEASSLTRCEPVATKGGTSLFTKGLKYKALIPYDIYTALSEAGMITFPQYKLEVTTNMKVYWKSASILANYSKLSMDLASLYSEKSFADVTFTFDQGKEIKAHKAILAARCSVLRTMIQMDDFVESRETRVDIPDVDHETFSELLYYIYAGRINPDLTAAEKVADLMAAAHKYAVDGLKDMCEREVKSRLNTENAAQVFIAADRHNLSSLKAASVDVIAREEEKFLQSDGYDSMRKCHPNLAIEMFESLTTARKRKQSGTEMIVIGMLNVSSLTSPEGSR